ncbi:MAG: cytochrome c3 family protein [Pseudomonadota bacterium]
MKVKNKIKQVLIPLFLILAAVLFVSGAYAYSPDIEFGGKKSRGAVAFPHENHMAGLDCTDCHHVMENGENILDESELEEDNPNILCGSCHNETSKIERKEAFHYQCMKCHNTYKMTQEKAGPTLCGECHILEK